MCCRAGVGFFWAEPEQEFKGGSGYIKKGFKKITDTVQYFKLESWQTSHKTLFIFLKVFLNLASFKSFAFLKFL